MVNKNLSLDEKNGFAQVCSLQICRKIAKKLRSKSGAKIVNATFTIASYLYSFFWYANVAFAIFAP